MSNTDKTVRRRRFLDTWRIGETECWLTDMAAQGLHLEDLTVFFAEFRQGEPEAVRYRIDYFDYKFNNVTEQRAFYAEGGWEYVCDWKNMQIFRSPDALNAPELHTDTAEQANNLERLKKRLTREAILVFILLPLMIGLTIVTYFLHKTPTLDLVAWGRSTVPPSVFLFIFSCFTALQSALSIRALVHTLREGRPINHRAPWQKYRRWNTVYLVVLLLIFIPMLFLPLVSISRYQTKNLPMENDSTIVLRLADIETDEALERPPPYPPLTSTGGIDFGNQITHSWSIYAPVQFETRESGEVSARTWPDGSGPYNPSLDYRYFDLTFPWMAKSLLEDLLIQTAPWREDVAPFATLDVPWAEQVLLREDKYMRELYIQKGNIVIYLQYHGMEDTDTVVAAVTALLNRI